MGPFTFVPTWVAEDLLVYLATVATVFHIIRTERRPITVLMEMGAFSILYAAVFENLATVEGLYGYGRSLIMVFNVPLSVPLFEFLVLYAALRMMRAMRVPTWLKPIGAGFLAVIADFALDPVSVKQVAQTAEGTIARWAWHTPQPHVMIYDEPVSNFTGWMLIIGLGATYLLIGRWWHRRSGYSPIVGHAYPVLAALAGLITLVSPVSNLVMYLGPLFPAGGASEVAMLVVVLVAPAVLFAVFWRGRMTSELTLANDYPIVIALGGLPLASLVFCVIGGHTQILWLTTLATVVPWAILWLVFTASKRTAIPLAVPSPPELATRQA